MIKQEGYLDALRARRQKSRVRTKHQLIGLVIATLLEDQEHKSLYIKLAKEGNPELFLEIAHDIADRPPVEHRGAYFMRVIERRGLILSMKRVAPKKTAKKKPSLSKRKRT